jgi:hypothetical protein
VVTGLAAGIERYFIDLHGKTGSPVTSGALFHDGRQPRAFVATLQLLAEQLEGYSSVTKVTTGQYTFRVGDATVYALWSKDAPAALQQAAAVTVYNMAGEASTVAGDDLEYSSQAPILAIIQE